MRQAIESLFNRGRLENSLVKTCAPFHRVLASYLSLGTNIFDVDWLSRHVKVKYLTAKACVSEVCRTFNVFTTDSSGDAECVKINKDKNPIKGMVEEFKKLMYKD